ncbi:MAG TPA: hypothetical protein VEI97_17170, partial [bacterium]|nr:hypothetical protein [bacterium]
REGSWGDRRQAEIAAAGLGNQASQFLYNAQAQQQQEQAKLRAEFASETSARAQAMRQEAARAQALVGQLAGRVLDPQRMPWAPGFQPGGPAERLAAYSGSAFTPIRSADVVTQVNPWQGLQQMAQETQQALAMHPGNPANPWTPPPLPEFQRVTIPDPQGGPGIEIPRLPFPPESQLPERPNLAEILLRLGIGQ